MKLWRWRCGAFEREMANERVCVVDMESDTIIFRMMRVGGI